MALDVKVNISLTKPIGKAGFGIPLVLVCSGDEVAYGEYKTLAEIVAAGFDESTDAYKAANVIFMQDNAPAKIAVCGTTGKASAWLGVVDNIVKGWRQLIVLGDDTAPTTVPAVIETLDNKMYFADVASTSFTGGKYDRTVIFCIPTKGECVSPAAALVGATAGLDAGSFTYKNLIIKGLEPQNLKDSEIDAIHSKGGITFVTKAGDNVTTEGKTAGGEYIDIIDSKDYVISNIEYQTQKMLNNIKKIPYDNNGIAMLESVAVNVMRDAYNQGIIATNEDGTAAYSVNYAKREDTSSTDRAERKYVGGQFKFILAGAVHAVEVTGEIEI